MKDMHRIIYDGLLDHDLIREEVGSKHIKYYQWPESVPSPRAFILIIPMEVTRPKEFASDTFLNLQMTYQIDVQADNRIKARAVGNAAREVMFELGYYQLPESLDEYLDKVNRYVDARRYRINTKLYEIDY